MEAVRLGSATALWREPESFERLVRRRGSFSFAKNVEGSAETILETAKRVREKVDGVVNAWPQAPLQHERDALVILALYLMEDRTWDAQNDMVCTLILTLVLADGIRGHSDGVVRYSQGAFRVVEECPASDMERIEKALRLSAVLCKEQMNNNNDMDLNTVFDALKPHATAMKSFGPVTSADFKKRAVDVYAAWAFDASKNMSSVISRFTGKQASSMLVDLVGTWAQQPKPEPNDRVVAFDDSCVRVNNAAGRPRLENCAKTYRQEHI